MNGYFSNIAKQSGLRFSREAAFPPQISHLKNAAPVPLSLIDTEEIVLAPSFGGIRRSIPSDLNELKQETPEARTTNSRSRREVDGNAVSFRPLDTDVVEPARGLNCAREAKPAVLRTGEMRQEVHAVDSEPVSHAKEGGRVVESSVKADGVSEQGRSIESTYSKLPEKHHFTRTAEIIGGRETEPADARTIVLKEVQEWIAAGPTEPEKSTHRMDETPASVPKMEKPVQRHDSKPGVVRIGDSHRSESMHREPMNESSSIREQVFDLSIGTINVVIEDDQRPLQPAPQPRRESRHERQETGRQPSRLSRSYI